MKIFTHRFTLWLAAIFLILICPSCFEIVEEINLNNDGSGSFCLTINMSQSKLDINAMLLLDSINGRAVPKIGDAKKTFARIEATLMNDSCISNIKTTKNWDEYIFSISGSFTNVEALNKAINNIYSSLHTAKGNTAPKDHFSYSNKVFKRLYNYSLDNDYNSLPEKDKMVFKSAKYAAIYRFKTPVSTYSNADALKSKSGMAIMLKTNIKDILTNHKTIENTIHLN
jgi:hypothetical protein